MNDEELLHGVGAYVRQEDDDPQLAVLERLARGEKVTESELEGIDAATIALFRPLDSAAERRIAEKIAPDNVRKVDFRRYVPFLVAAAAIVLFFAWPRTPNALPRYAFELSGNVAELRSDGPQVPSARAKLHKKANLDLVLRPEGKVAGKIEVRAALVRDGKPRAWTPPVAISEEGAVRITGPVKTLFPDVDGPWEILIAIGPESTLPADAESLQKAAREATVGVRIVRGFVEFTP